MAKTKQKVKEVKVAIKGKVEELKELAKEYGCSIEQAALIESGFLKLDKEGNLFDPEAKKIARAKRTKQASKVAVIAK